MTTMPMHVISNGELTRAALNAVVVLLATSTFATAIKISTLFAIIGTAVSYIRGRDLIILARWFVIYFILSVIMLGPRVNLEIIDSSNPGAVYTVGNVPYGLGLPASLITSMAHGLVSSFEEAFSPPDDFTYSKTGMLFGSRLFRLSTEFGVTNPAVKTELNEYVKNCVLGDMLITQKYTMNELLESGNLLDTITKSPSNIRGIYIDGKFKTCLAAAPDLKNHLTKDASHGFEIFGKRIFSRFKADEASQKIQTSLASVYDHFNYGGLSNSALQIMTQNFLINGVREGITNYTAEAGATAALLNLSTTQAMERMRMTLATSRNIATYTIPIIHTVLLLLMLSLFPVVILLAFQPSFTIHILKNYLYTLIWIESWPLMFACLNLVVNFYAKSEIGPTLLTINNVNQLALEHSDIANMAGYLMMAIPFISGGLVTGMASSFNTAASYLGGVLQSSASSAASEAASGNIHLGNSSWNNVNANKFDTNSTNMQGASTKQLASGLMRTTTADGTEIYDSSHTISKLPVHVRASDVLSESFSQQAEAAKSAAIQDQRSYDQSISSAVSDMNSAAESYDSRKSHGEGFNSREAESSASSASSMKSLATNIAKRNSISVDDAFKGLVNFSQGITASAGGSLPGKTFGVNIVGSKIGADGKISFEHTRTNETSTRHDVGRSMDITAEEANRFSNDLHKVQEYSKTQHAETNRSAAESQLFQLSSSLNKAQNASQHYSTNIAESNRLSNSASLVRHNSAQIDSDLGQEIAGYVAKKDGREAAELQFAGKDRARLEANAKEYVLTSGVENKILSSYQQNSSGINPSQQFQSGQEVIANKKSGIIVAHNEQSQGLINDAQVGNAALKTKANNDIFKQGDFNQVNDSIGNNYDQIDDKIKKADIAAGSKYNELNEEVSKNIKDGIKNSRSTTGGIKPEFTKKQEEDA